MAHQPKKFNIKGLDGISDNQISQHMDILYVGYVNKLNEVEERLKAVDRSKANQIFSDFRGLKADESFALNGVILHELYFENLNAKGEKKSSGKLTDLIAREFGSFETWQAARGWVILGHCLYDGKLHNYCLDTHNFNVPACVIPVLVMDVYEHAYVIDYGVKRPPYIDAFMKNIDWSVCQKRLSNIDSGKNIMQIAAS